MKVPEEKQYEYLTNKLCYLNEKMIEAFGLFIKLATVIIGGVFYVHMKLDGTDSRRTGIGCAADGMLLIVGIGAVIMIVTNLSAWRECRKTLTKEYPDIPPINRWRWWIIEFSMCLLMGEGRGHVLN